MYDFVDATRGLYFNGVIFISNCEMTNGRTDFSYFNNSSVVKDLKSQNNISFIKRELYR